MTRDALHAQLYALQQRFLGWLPYPVREALSGILLVPMVFAFRETGASLLLAQWLAFVAFFAGSNLYEWLMAPPKASDVLWRQVGALGVWLIWSVLT